MQFRSKHYERPQRPQRWWKVSSSVVKIGHAWKKAYDPRGIPAALFVGEVMGAGGCVEVKKHEIRARGQGGRSVITHTMRNTHYYAAEYPHKYSPCITQHIRIGSAHARKPISALQTLFQSTATRSFANRLYGRDPRRAHLRALQALEAAAASSSITHAPRPRESVLLIRGGSVSRLLLPLVLTRDRRHHGLE